MATAELIPLVFAALVGYLLGSIPFPYLAVRLKTGEDLRHVHTGNVGVMNSMSVLGRYLGFGVALMEFGKGFSAAWLGLQIADEYGAWIALVLAVVGANWPVWLRFSGGRGNTTLAGGLLLFSGPAGGLVLCLLDRKSPIGQQLHRGAREYGPHAHLLRHVRVVARKISRGHAAVRIHGGDLGAHISRQTLARDGRSHGATRGWQASGTPQGRIAATLGWSAGRSWQDIAEQAGAHPAALPRHVTSYTPDASSRNELRCSPAA